MKRMIFGTLLALCLLTMIGIIPAMACSPATQLMSPPFQLTTDPHYDRNPSFFQANDGTYWLFFTRGRSGGVRVDGGYDPDYDLYDIYYKTARSIPGLIKATENLVPGSNLVRDNTQRDIAALQASNGTIWLFASSGYGPSTDSGLFYYTYTDGVWSSRAKIPDIDAVIGHIDALKYDDKIFVVYDIWDLIPCVKMISGVGDSWSSPVLVASYATLPKAIIDDNTFYVVWTTTYGYTDIYLSTSEDGDTWDTYGPIASWSGATNWDPVLIKDKNTFRLFWAPDTGDAEGQFIAMSKSINPTNPASWSTPVRVTTASYGGENWWDFWPQPYRISRGVPGLVTLFYTSERNIDGTSRIDGNIWLRIILDLP
jgi:hypothetical protein